MSFIFNTLVTKTIYLSTIYTANPIVIAFIGLLIILLTIILISNSKKNNMNQKNKKIKNNSKDFITNTSKEEYKNIENNSELYEYICTDSILKEDLDKFISDIVKKFDDGEINFNTYKKEKKKFVNKLNKNFDSKNINFKITTGQLQNLFKVKEMKDSSDEMKRKIKYNELKDIQEIIKSYIERYGESSLKPNNIRTLEFITNESYYNLKDRIGQEIGNEQKENEYNEIEVQRAFFKYISSDKELSKKLDEFILNYVRKYDTEQISLEKYLKRIEQLVEYLMNKINIRLHNRNDEKFEELKKVMGSNKINVTYTELEKFINDRKYEIYSREMEKKINVNEYKNTEDLVNDYIVIYGKRSINEVNIKTLSVLSGKDYSELKEEIESEYNRIQTTYKLNKLEEELFSGEEVKDISYVDSLSGFEFEDFLKELFQSFGYSAEDLPYSNDYGADLIISKGTNKIVIQAKNYNGNVGNKAVQEVVSAKVYYKCDLAMVITNSYFTQNAIETAKGSDVIMINRDKLDKILTEGQFYFDSIAV